MFMKCLGLEFGPLGVRCNTISPGTTDTEMLHALSRDDSWKSKAIAGDPGLFRTGIPLGKIAQPMDIAPAVLFLLSDEAGHITMQELLIDGGATLV